jgi:hypothetical protein
VEFLRDSRVAMVAPNVFIVFWSCAVEDKLLQAPDSFGVLVLQRHSNTDHYKTAAEVHALRWRSFLQA